MISKKTLKSYLVNLLLKGDRRNRRVALRAIDFAVFSLSLYFAIALRFESLLPLDFFAQNTWKIFVLIPIQLIIFQVSGIYRSVLRYSSLNLVRDLAKAVAISAAILIALTYFLTEETLPRSILLINACITLISLVYVRIALRWLLRKGLSHHKKQLLSSDHQYKRLLVYGAGGAGSELLQSLSHSPQYKVVGFVDDQPALQKRLNMEGVAIHNPQKITTLWEKDVFDAVVLAMPSIASATRRRIAERLRQQAIPVLTVPSLTRILSGKVTIQELQDVNILDLLGREEVSPDLELLKRQLQNNAVLVTGAGGSIGSELCRQIARQQPGVLVLYERNEFALYKIHQELSKAYPQLHIVPCLGSVTDGVYLCRIFRQYKVKTVYHAAAYKHVPLLESNIVKGVENNVLGTLSAARSAIKSGVSQFVLISTDKAVRPTNIMGTTKRVAELTIQALSNNAKSNGAKSNGAESKTRFAIVRFGNVLGSSGSVVPLFRKQIAEGGPVTLTHREITRYFMSIPEAARLVIQAGSMSRGGEVFLLDMGQPIKIYDLAVRMIVLSGLTPGQDIDIKITGLRPGEKLYEELLISGDNTRSTHHPKIYCGQEAFFDWACLLPQLNELMARAAANDSEGVKVLLKRLVPEYQPREVALPAVASKLESEKKGRSFQSVG